jgi:RNA polymerase sigma-70 factor (ECF subfamily)
MTSVTQLLQQWRAGDPGALGRLTPMIYPELRRLARIHMRKERDGHTIQPTALVHEAYLRMVGGSNPEFQNRSHFFAIAANLMRQILVDHAREQRAQKRGSGQKPIDLDDCQTFTLDQSDNLLYLHEALEKLATFDERKAKALEMRFFGGLTSQEISEALGVSIPTVTREMRLATAWLRKEMGG